MFPGMLGSFMRLISSISIMNCHVHTQYFCILVELGLNNCFSVPSFGCLIEFYARVQFLLVSWSCHLYIYLVLQKLFHCSGLLL